MNATNCELSGDFAGAKENEDWSKSDKAFDAYAYSSVMEHLELWLEDALDIEVEDESSCFKFDLACFVFKFLARWRSEAISRQHPSSGA